VAPGQPVAVVETSVAVTASVVLAVSLARHVRRGAGVAAFVSPVTGVGSSGLTNGFHGVRGWQEHGEVAVCWLAKGWTSGEDPMMAVVR
jgi:hypothetical protein